jgi:hypothetical protein
VRKRMRDSERTKTTEYQFKAERVLVVFHCVEKTPRTRVSEISETFTYFNGLETVGSYNFLSKQSKNWSEPGRKLSVHCLFSNFSKIFSKNSCETVSFWRKIRKIFSKIQITKRVGLANEVFHQEETARNWFSKGFRKNGKQKMHNMLKGQGNESNQVYLLENMYKGLVGSIF